MKTVTTTIDADRVLIVTAEGEGEELKILGSRSIDFDQYEKHALDPEFVSLVGNDKHAEALAACRAAEPAPETQEDKIERLAREHLAAELQEKEQAELAQAVERRVAELRNA